MTEFINMYKNYANFSDRTTVRGYWMAYLFMVIFAVVATILSFVAVAAGSEALSLIISLIMLVWGLATVVPSIAMAIRRLRDSGREWYYYLLVLVPLVGTFILIYFLIQPSIADDGTPVV